MIGPPAGGTVERLSRRPAGGRQSFDLGLVVLEEKTGIDRALERGTKTSEIIGLAAGVETAARRRVERRRAPEQEGEAVTGLAEPGQDREGHLEPGSPDPAPGVAGIVEREAVAVELKTAGRRWGHAS